ncbi:MAG: hypothetical protein KY468_14045 [Armatimonadetes bacterium]|nr:hypothetical protein [Armatimonadota bacterium]
MEKSGLSTYPSPPREISLAKLLFITFIVPILAALFAAVTCPERPPMVVHEDTAMLSMERMQRSGP